jgi:hypothetical protein
MNIIVVMNKPQLQQPTIVWRIYIENEDGG